MISFIAGIAILIGTVFVFWHFKPKDGQVHRVVASIWGPYVGIFITSGFAIGSVMALSGVISILS